MLVYPASSRNAVGLSVISMGEPPRSPIPSSFGAGIVQVCSITGGETMPPNRDLAANSGSRYTGFMSSSAYAQCRIIGWLTGSGATEGLALPPVGWPTRALSLLCSSVSVTERILLVYRMRED